MREVGPSSDATTSASASNGPPSEPAPPSSSRGFIGTNIDKAQAYVPPTTLPETPEPPVPNAKVALSDTVDPRKAPTHPNLKKAAQVIASELQAERQSPPPAEAPPDSQSSGVRRGAGYAPSRSNFPAPIAPAARPDASLRSTPPKPLQKTSIRPAPPPVDAPETPAQRRAALLLIFLFAALLAVAVYFFLRKAPPPHGETPTTTGTPTARTAPLPVAPSPSLSPSPAPSTSVAPDPSSLASGAPVTTPLSPSPSTSPRASTSPAPTDATPAPTSASAAPPSASASATTAPGPDKPKTERWF